MNADNLGDDVTGHHAPVKVAATARPTVTAGLWCAPLTVPVTNTAVNTARPSPW